MSEVATVLGSVAPEQLGVTLPHEHLLFSLDAYWMPSDDVEPDAPISVERLAEVRRRPLSHRRNLTVDEPDLAIAEMSLLKAAGASTVVDATPRHVGRSPMGLRKVAESTGLHIVAGCGWYVDRFHPADLQSRPVADLAAEILRELTEGIDDSSVRAGVIGEIGAGAFPMSNEERRVLTAAAEAQQETGAGIIAHPAPGSVESAFEIVDVLEQAGAALDRVVVSHVDVRLRDDFTAYLRLGSTGVFLGFDTFGRELHWPKTNRQHPSDAERVAAVATLVNAGLEHQLLLSQDICMRHELATYGGHGYSHLMQTVVPALRARGFGDPLLEILMRDNPRYLLTGTRSEEARRPTK